MTKTLVTYLSQTGNTKKIADAIFESLEGDKTIEPVDEVQETRDYSLIFIGFPVHSHSVPYKIEGFLRKIPEGKKIALFSTHSSLPGGHLATEALEHAAALAKEVLLEKHKRRGDSWRQSFTLNTLIGLAKAKTTRVDMLYMLINSDSNQQRAFEEAVEELLDTINYCAFQIYMLTVDKHTVPMRPVE